MLRSSVRPLCLLVGFALIGCGGNTGPCVETAADSLALRIAEAAGGFEAFDALSMLRFDWTAGRDNHETTRRHLWDRAGDRARVEWTREADSAFVTVVAPGTFDPTAPAGQAALNGQPLDGDVLASALVEAYEAHVNDTYWLLAPLKTFAPGVRRAIDRDSGATTLALAFDGADLTPGDRYWLYTDPVSGAMLGWSFHLQSGATGRWDWTDPQPIATPRGEVLLPTVKTNVATGATIVTQPLPSSADETLFTDLRPRLAPGAATP